MIPLRDNVRARRVPVVTLALIAANISVFIVQLGLPPLELRESLEVYGVVPQRFWLVLREGLFPLVPGEFLTLVTAGFLHGGWGHLISNLWGLWLFGDNVEDRLGPVRFLIFYVLCGVMAMGAHVLLHAGSNIPAIGASGSIGGVMGAYLVLFPFARMVVMVPILFYPLLVEIPAVVFLVLWFISQVTGAAVEFLARISGVGGVAFWAHVGGFLSGMFIGRRWGAWRRLGLARYA